MTPTPEEIKTHFASAREIKCWDYDIFVNINHVEILVFNEEKHGYYANGGIICVWNNDKGYAPISKTKCNKPSCKKCNCKDE